MGSLKGYIKGENHRNYKKLSEIEQKFAYVNKLKCEDIKILLRRYVTNNFEVLNVFSEALCLDLESVRYVEVLETACSLDYKLLSLEEWDLLRFISTIRGRLLLSHYCREKAIKRVKETKGFHAIFKRVSVLIEQNEITDATNLLNEYYSLPLKKSDIYKRYSELCDILSGKRKLLNEFSKFVKNRRVIIIGPAPGEEKLVDYKKSDDIIVRFTYRGKKHIPESNRDLPVNISYYNLEASTNLLINQPDFLSDLDFYVCRIKGIEKKDPKGRFQRVYNSAIPFGIILSGQACMIDLLQFDLNGIFVTNYNMFYSREKHDKEYETVKIIPYQTYAYHDIEGNFLLAKNLRKNGFISCDSNLNHILDMSVEEYMAGLESIDHI